MKYHVFVSVGHIVINGGIGSWMYLSNIGDLFKVVFLLLGFVGLSQVYKHVWNGRKTQPVFAYFGVIAVVLSISLAFVSPLLAPAVLSIFFLFVQARRLLAEQGIRFVLFLFSLLVVLPSISLLINHVLTYDAYLHWDQGLWTGFPTHLFFIGCAQLMIFLVRRQINRFALQVMLMAGGLFLVLNGLAMISTLLTEMNWMNALALQSVPSDLLILHRVGVNHFFEPNSTNLLLWAIPSICAWLGMLWMFIRGIRLWQKLPRQHATQQESQGAVMMNQHR